VSECYIKLRSNYLDGIIDLAVILPNPFVGHNPKNFYSSGEKYPVLWLLHGGSETSADWITYSSAPRLAVWRNTIIVAPSMPNGDFINQPRMGEGYRFFDFFYGELMPFIYNWLPASDDPAKNFLAGNSMGCEAVWRHGLQNPDAFGCIAPLGDKPCDYSCLEGFRSMTGEEFRDLTSDGSVTIGGGSEKISLRRREINNISKYPTVGAFLDSIENTMARFNEAVLTGKLPNVFFPYGATERESENAAFAKQLTEIGISIIKTEYFDEPVGCMSFWEKALEKFVDYVGHEPIEKNDGSLPIMTGANDVPDDSCGITIH